MEEMHTYQEFLFHTLFSSVATLALAASLYLLLRRHNAFAADINPPLRLRRWTAAFFAAEGISHLYWLLIRYGPLDGDLFDRSLLCTAFDTILPAPILLCTMLVMLQDRRRPLWPIGVASALTFVYLLLVYFLDVRSTAFILLPILMIFIFIIVMLRALRQYHRWLLDNYADLEHKEARISIGVLAAFVLISVAYGFANDYFFFEVFIEVTNILLIAVLLWRVETMQTLQDSAADGAYDMPITDDAIYQKLESLLQEHCVDRQYYLKHDGNISQLAKLMGSNRNYLSQHFTQQGLTYNSYINSLRIQHFMRLYKECVSSGQPIVAEDLAKRCGFRSYSTFSRAFKQVVDQNVSEWMEERK